MKILGFQISSECLCLPKPATLIKGPSFFRDSILFGLQIHMTTGTANGVLVVRTDKQCRQLLEAILMNEAEFRIVEEGWGTALVESISDSRFRVVTKHPVLTAAFWNFFEPTPHSAYSRIARS